MGLIASCNCFWIVVWKIFLVPRWIVPPGRRDSRLATSDPQQEDCDLLDEMMVGVLEVETRAQLGERSQSKTYSKVLL
jgi:hypothetical protein